MEDALVRFPIVVIGTVSARPNDLEARLEPEVFLKGPARADTIDLRLATRDDDCPRASFIEGERVLLFMSDGPGDTWPPAFNAFTLRDGQAIGQWDDSYVRSESELVGDIRRVTGQYAVPAASADEGAGIDWWKTVVPVSVATLALFGVGLYLMRIWHRIDPT